jgi:integrase
LASFCIYYDVAFPLIGIHTLLAFIEFLISSDLAVPTVKNYVSSIKTYFKCNGVNIEVFNSHQLALTLSSLTKNYSPPVSLKPIFSPQQFVQLIKFSNQLPLHNLYKIAFIFGYLALFCISNVAPTSFAAFDPLRHLRRGDVSIVGSSIIIHLRWTKTLQKYRQSARIRLFAIPGSPVCPLAAFISLQRSHPVLPSDPFLSYRVSGRLYIITQNHLRRSLKRLVASLSFSPHLTFHAFRRSGASLAFASGVPFQAIQAHGTWASDALWAYIDASARDATVPQFFANVFSSL